jgi:hypothetical protein
MSLKDYSDGVRGLYRRNSLGVHKLERFTRQKYDESASARWSAEGDTWTGSVETLAAPIDKYELSHFAADDPKRFLDLVKHLSPRDAEIILCFAVLQKGPTDISTLFGKAGHRAEEDLHKAAHKLAGLVEFGSVPEGAKVDRVLERHNLTKWGNHSFRECVSRYSVCRSFPLVTAERRQRGLRQQMLRSFRILHASDDREAGLLAGWLLWLVDGSNPNAKGWRKRRRTGRECRLGPTVFRSSGDDVEQLRPRASGKGGQGQRPDVVKITRQMRFMLRGNVKKA